MATPPALSPEEMRARARQRQLDALATRAVHEQADAAVEVAATAGAYAALCAHAGLVLIGAWRLTRGGPVRGFSTLSQIGAGVLMFDGFLRAIDLSLSGFL